MRASLILAAEPVQAVHPRFLEPQDVGLELRDQPFSPGAVFETPTRLPSRAHVAIPLFVITIFSATIVSIDPALCVPLTSIYSPSARSLILVRENEGGNP
jgi:hypothetical protein